MSDHLSDQVNNLLARVPAGKSSGKYLDQVDPATREVLNQFEAYLKEIEKKSEATARQYKGYVAKAMVELENDPEFELDTDVRSAINAMRRFDKFLEGPPPSSLDDLDELEIDVPESGDVE